MKKLFILVLIIVLLLFSISCEYKVTSELLSYAAGIEPDISEFDFEDQKYSQALWNFAAELMQKESSNKNTILSPLSAYLALAMLANGAANNTLEEFETVLGLSKDELNSYCYCMTENLLNRNEATINIANSLWVDKDKNCDVKKAFLDTNSLYYNMDVYRDSFSNKRTIKNINNWIRNATNNYIKEAIEEITPEIALILINTLYFECNWLFDGYSYDRYNFTNANNEEIKTKFISDMISCYYSSESAKAIRIPLKDDFYFMGILPNENDINSYLQNFNSEELRSLITNSDSAYDVYWRLPKFSYEYKAELKESLNDMGLVDVFVDGKSDLSDLGNIDGYNFYANEVIQKSKIELDKDGIKAGSITYIPMCGSAAPKEKMYIYFNRPFAYAIMDGKTDTPLFIGTVKEI